MVVFTCNNCGDSVKKPAVTKHLSYECKNKYAGVSLCCIDCLKDFDCDTFAGHTKCVSELERYSGSNFVPKASSNKGERKQNSWISTVRSVLDQPTLKNDQRKLLEVISQFENVPRKKPKFMNFIKSSVRTMRVYPNLVDSVFELLENEFKKSASSETKVGNSNDEKNAQHSDEIEKKKAEKNENGVLDEGALKQGETVAKKTKKRKTETCNEEGVLENGEEIVKRKKIQEEPCQVNGEDVTINGEQASLKKKKKKRKMESLDESEAVACDSQSVVQENGVEQSFQENGQDVTINGEEASLKKKKKKRKLESLDEPVAVSCDSQMVKDSVVQENDVDEQVSRKKKKKKQKITEVDDEGGVPCDTENCDTLTNGKESTSSNKDADDEIENVKVHATSEKKKKKKKKDKCDGNDEVEAEKTEIVDCGESHTEKREPGDSTRVELESEIDVDHQKSEIEPEIRVKFNWEEVVADVLAESPNRELSMKKIKKKVAKKYLQFHGDDKSFEDIVKRFEKKLKRMSNVDVDEKKIRLRE